MEPDDYWSAKFQVLFYHTMEEACKEEGGIELFKKKSDDHMPDDKQLQTIVTDLKNFFYEGPFKKILDDEKNDPDLIDQDESDNDPTKDPLLG